MEMEETSISTKRTPKQNNSLHKYFELLAEALNDAGFDIRKTLKSNFNIPWTKGTIKEIIWKPVQDAYLRKKSTTELTTAEVNQVWEVINRELGEKTGVHVEFPHDEKENR